MISFQNSNKKRSYRERLKYTSEWFRDIVQLAWFKYLGMLFLLLISSCEKSNNSLQNDKLFSSIPAELSGVDFSNQIIESEDFHYYKYIYSYNGAGVAAADFNNDGLIDLFFTSNLFQSKLYLNKGDVKFNDITAESGIVITEGYNAGVTVVDINNDGFLDIYICRAGWFEGDEIFANKLYVNNGNLTFSEKAKEYGLDDRNRSICSTFFDYDKDGDLDVYISNSPDDYGLYSQILDLKEIQSDPKYIAHKGSDKLFSNDGAGHFTDVSTQAGIKQDIAFGLAVQVADLNNDGWQDIFVDNDFSMPDFALINNGDGTFSDQRNQLFKHISFSSMGSDFADINNDGLGDLMVLDMKPEDHVRNITTMSKTSPKRFNEMVRKNYHYQYMHNMLQLNNGNSTFSEIGNMAGITDTDWSWATLLADFDLDGYNDIYITNGVFRDVMDKDKLMDIKAILRQNRRKPTDMDFLKFTQMLPQKKLMNYLYRNNGDLSFEDKSTIWADSSPTFSNGAIYADLDNDGDLDIVVNNINEEATILKNNARELNGGNYLQIRFAGEKSNRFGVGACVNLLLENGQVQTRQLINGRGYLSSVSNILHFGLGDITLVDKMEVVWPDGKQQILTNISANQLLTLQYAKAQKTNADSKREVKTLLSKLNANFEHSDPLYDDFQKQLLLPHKLSQTGPAVAKSDVNNDGIEDLFLGGGHKQPGQLLIGNSKGSFDGQVVKDFDSDRLYEDVGACFFDIDNDGDDDLYVVSGSYEFEIDSELLQDRLYINDGKGNFKTTENILPEMLSAGSLVKPCDFDRDGDLDLFVGGRVIPGKYPYPPTSYLLINNKGSLSVATQQLSPELENVGMVTDAQWVDINNDDQTDLVVTGEWMGIEVFINENNRLVKSDLFPALSSSTGWWNRLLVVDVDNDGNLDIIAGNLGLNYRFQASRELPFHVYTYDFENNGIEDIILAKKISNKLVPLKGKIYLTQQIPPLAQKISTYVDFANRDLGEILGADLKSALHYQATELRSGIFFKTDSNNYSFIPFTNAVQRSPINSIVYEDFDGDGVKDLLLAGNNYQSEIETTRSDAGIGSLLSGIGDGTFTYHTNLESGFFADKDVRNIVPIDTPHGRVFVVVNNNNSHDLFGFNRQE